MPRERSELRGYGIPAAFALWLLAYALSFVGAIYGGLQENGLPLFIISVACLVGCQVALMSGWWLHPWTTDDANE